MKIFLLFSYLICDSLASTRFRGTTCPQLWTAEWARGMAQVFEKFIFKEVVTDPDAWNLNGKARGVNCVGLL